MVSGLHSNQCVSVCERVRVFEWPSRQDKAINRQWCVSSVERQAWRMGLAGDDVPSIVRLDIGD